MTFHVNPLRLAVMFDGDQRDIQGMARDAVGQLAETAKSLGRDVLVKGAQTMDVQRGGVVNWSNWVSVDAFDQNRNLQLAHCNRSNSVILGALQPLAVENEILAKVDWAAPRPRHTPEKIDAVLIATGRDQQGISQELRDMFQLDQVLKGMEAPARGGKPNLNAGLACTPQAGHSGLIKQGTRVYSLATILGVEDIIQEKLSAPTSGMSFHGKSGEIKQLVDAMAVTLADPDAAHARLAGNRFARLMAPEYSKA
jgi:hypothetical protein